MNPETPQCSVMGGRHNSTMPAGDREPTPASAVELLPCPFCGGPAVDEGWKIVCDKCGARCYNKAEGWNIRAQPTPASDDREGLVERLREALSLLRQTAVEVNGKFGKDGPTWERFSDRITNADNALALSTPKPATSEVERAAMRTEALADAQAELVTIMGIVDEGIWSEAEQRTIPLTVSDEAAGCPGAVGPGWALMLPDGYDVAKANGLQHAEVERLRAEIINTPETADFMAGVPIEAAHQRERWASAHDAGKTPLDWFWLLGYLGQKAARAAEAGDIEKALHHTISTAAALANWHAALSGSDTAMRPGIEPPAALAGKDVEP